MEVKGRQSHFVTNIYLIHHLLCSTEGKKFIQVCNDMRVSKYDRIKIFKVN